jgi:hypothetical protein
MLSTVTTLTSICEDVCHSVQIKQHDLKPYNRQLLNDDYVNKLSNINDESIHSSSLLFTSTANFKHLFRSSHVHASHVSRASLWYHLLRHDHTHHQHRFQQAVERYPEDIR